MLRRCEELGIHIRHVVAEAGFDWMKWKIYYFNNNTGERGKSQEISHENVIKLAKTLGIDVKVRLVVLTKSFNPEELKQKISARKASEKKRIVTGPKRDDNKDEHDVG